MKTCNECRFFKTARAGGKWVDNQADYCVVMPAPVQRAADWPIEDLVRPGYAVSDIRHLTRRHALEQGLPLLPALEWRRKKGE